MLSVSEPIETTLTPMMACFASRQQTRTSKERAQGCSRGGGIADQHERACVTAFRHETDTVTWNDARNGESVDGSLCHVETSCLVGRPGSLEAGGEPGQDNGR